MARARNIKPGFFKNEDLAECSLAARLCFAGLWTLADREGRLEDRPKRIKAELFAFDSFDAEPLLVELERRRFIVRYEVDGQRCIQISKFLEHQTPHYSEKPSVIKPHPLQEIAPDLATEKTKSRPARKKGAQPPDSLNPDSPNPEEEITAPSGLVDRSADAPSDDPPGLPGIEPKPKASKAYSVPDCPYAEIQAAYHETLAMLPKATVLNDARREHVRARWREVCAEERFDTEAGLEWFRWYFRRVAQSRLLSGRGRPKPDGSTWRASFDWLFNPTNFAKVIDGNYVDERTPA